ncbi:MAG: hypothetical protein GXY83_17350 [Rhodopirellula sp.]|nr:hypothetical protein [Rhodopirellula sp.]
MQRPRRQRKAIAVLAKLCAVALLHASAGHAATVSLHTDDGLAAQAEGTTLTGMTLDGHAIPEMGVDLAVIDPRSGQNAAGFNVEARWTSERGCLRLEGEVRVPCGEDTVADLVIRVRGVDLPASRIAENPLLLPARLVSKLPLVSLRAGGKDSLALAVPPDRLAIYRFANTAEGAELRFPFGFTKDAKPELRLRAPFACVIYRSDPKWHFRSALQQYYRLFREPFTPFIRKGGGWFFAAPTKDLPNPQHFYYHEGRPAEWDEDDQRGLATFPYQESSSSTIRLPGKDLPKSYAEAMDRFAELEKRVTPRAWTPQNSFTLDAAARRSGNRSLLADTGTTGDWTGGRQAILFEKPVREPIVVRGFSKAEGVSGQRDSGYSIYVDVCYASGGYLFGQCATFSTGSHDWETGEYVIRPAEPVAELRVYCLLRGHPGKAWFDDIHVGPASQPEVNWLVNPGFEEDEKRRDLQHVRNNVCVNSRGEYVVAITNNLSADVGPAEPLNLLRFTLNVDPDLPDTNERPNVAGRQFESYDRIFREYPSVDGCYIDSVSAWCYRVLNCRRDQWPANDRPFGYDPSTFQVVAHGRFAMTDFLAALQRRYHPQGKAIFTNIHVNLEAFPLYLVSDVPGIESSQFQDQDSTFFYRACSYKKPVLLMNFMNLHGLDKREVAERFYHNAAQWGELPSTGRFVKEAYRLYGDVTHAWMPAIRELAEAGWEPIPLASGAQVERFPADGAVYFTLRAPENETAQTLVIEAEATKDLGQDLVAANAVSLEPIAIERRNGSCVLRIAHGKGQVTVLRIASRANTRQWLLGRARDHVAAACRVRGKAGLTPELTAARDALQRITEPDSAAIRRAHGALDAAIHSMPADGDDLFLLSTKREIQQAEQTIAAWDARLATPRQSKRPVLPAQPCRLPDLGSNP